MKTVKILFLSLAASFFIAGIGGWDQSTGAEPGAHTKPRIFIVTPMSHSSLDQSMKGFLRGLREKGYGRDKVEIEMMNAGGDYSRIPVLVKQAVSKKPALVFAVTTPAASQAVEVTDKARIPLVYAAVTDPVAAGIVTGMEASETLATGVSDRYPVREQVKVFVSLFPKMARAALLYNPSEENSRRLVGQTIEHLRDRGVRGERYAVQLASEIKGQAQKALKECDCLIVNGDNLVTEHLKTVVTLCRDHKKPLFVGDPESVKEGAIAAVGPSYHDMGRRAGHKAAQVLGGRPVQEIPSEYPTSFHYVVNPRAAEGMGVKIPQAFWMIRDLWESTTPQAARSCP